MDKTENIIDCELFLEKFEMLSLKIEQLTNEISQMKVKLDKSNKMNRTFGLKALRNSSKLDFAQDIFGIGSPTKRYLLSLRAATEEWKGRRSDVLLTVRQQDKESHEDLKALGIRIPINDIKSIRTLAKEVISLLFIACELKNVEINEILRDVLSEINIAGPKMVKEIKNKMFF